MDLKLEQVTVHSRDIFARYVPLKAGETMTYSIKPQRNSIYFGLYRKRARDVQEAVVSPAKNKSSLALSVSLSFEERIRQADLELIAERVKLQGGKVCKGSIQADQDGMYAVVLDNTFSKQKSKLVTFIIQVYAKSEIPGKSETLLDDEEFEPQVAEEQLTGILLKRRRKKLQGWAKRYFVLDFQNHTLSYHINAASTVLRGSIPLSIAVISADRDRHEINIDSGAEVWNLRASNRGAWVMWCEALGQVNDEKLQNYKTMSSSVISTPKLVSKSSFADAAIMEKNLWTRLEQVQADLTRVQESLRILTVNETLPSSAHSDDRKRQLSPARPTMLDTTKTDVTSSRRSFWSKRKTSELTLPNNATEELFAQAKLQNAGVSQLIDIDDKLTSALKKFTDVLKEHKYMSQPPVSSNILREEYTTRKSFDSMRSANDVFEDAPSGFEEQDGILMVHRESDSDSDVEIDDAASDEASSVYELAYDLTSPLSSRGLTPIDEKLVDDVLSGVKLAVQRRVTIPPILDSPPSTLKLISQKVGSDVSSMSVPAASNEPLSLLQRTAEDLEYSELLDQAEGETDPVRKLLLVATFAISSFSSMRHKERAKRKPFNPMLGETYELIREDKGFIFVAEKVQHRPVVGIASYAESKLWTFQQYQATTQKFYGKSMVLTTEGLTTVRFRSGDIFVWEKPTAYLRNASWGEKWLEPSGDMRIRNLTNGDSALIKFKAVGTFSTARSEEVSIQALGRDNDVYSCTVEGNWTEQLALNGTTIWQAGQLVQDASKHCGLSVFATQLNEITPIEKEHMAPTDSRYRPDLRAREEGRLNDAERCKVELEEAQRSRRAELERLGKPHSARFFAQAGETQEWNPVHGPNNYWTARKTKQWNGLVDLFHA